MGNCCSITSTPPTGGTNTASTTNNTANPHTPLQLPQGTSSVAGGAVAPHNAGRGALWNSLTQEQKDTVRHTYNATRQFHGTSETGKASIQQNGFNRQLKGGGATGTIPNLDPNSQFATDAAGHNYLTNKRDVAKNYAVTSRDPLHQPALVRTVVDPTVVHLEPDPDSLSDDEAFRTSGNIAAGYVLQSKNHGDHTRSGAANQQFQARLDQNGLSFTVEEAGELLNEVQSDSDSEDFSTATPMVA